MLAEYELESSRYPIPSRLLLIRCSFPSGRVRKELVFTTSGFSTPVGDARLMFYFPGYAAAGEEYWMDKAVLEEY